VVEKLVKGLLGTHAHKMTSLTQQPLLCYDQEAGRRCGLKVRLVAVLMLVLQNIECLLQVASAAGTKHAAAIL
jgi:hypothetical protein